MVPLLRTVLVGQPRCIDDNEPWVTAFFKEAVTGAVFLATGNLTGDRQADLTVHGGPDKAVCVYSADHYAAWRAELATRACVPGWFGENFTVDGQTEQSVAIGDIYRVGTALVQVSQPRGPCWKLGRRWRRPDLPKLVVRSGRSGWYLRVLEEGAVIAGEPLVLVERESTPWTIAQVNAATYARGVQARRLKDVRHALAHCAALASSWRLGLTDAT